MPWGLKKRESGAGRNQPWPNLINERLPEQVATAAVGILYWDCFGREVLKLIWIEISGLKFYWAFREPAALGQEALAAR